MEAIRLKNHLTQIFNAGVAAVNPAMLISTALKIDGDQLLVNHAELNLKLNLNDFDEIVVLGCGKAAAPMAKALEELLGARLTRGAIAVKYGHTVNLRAIQTMEAGHPVPDINGITASIKIMEIAQSVTPKSLVIMLTTGGGSALLPAPAPGLNLELLQKTTALLLESGADINAINCVRKHLSAIKGGRLAKLMEGATVLNLLLSDVQGDNIGAIASGPCAPDFTSYADARQILETYGLWDKIPPKVSRHIDEGMAGLQPETPDMGDPCFAKAHQLVLAGNRHCTAACCAKAQTLGYNSRVLPQFYTGEAKEAGRSLYGLTIDMAKNLPSAQRPLCLVCGGEATVTLPENYGKGGRATEAALAFLVELLKHESAGVVMLSAATDGNDGPTDAAGAFVTQDVIDNIFVHNLKPEKALEEHDSYTFFSRVEGLLKTGPTNTNVCDIGIFIIS